MEEVQELKIKKHNISAEEFEKNVFFAHVINGVTVTFDKEVTVEFKMTHADAGKSVGEWGGEGLAKVLKTDKKTIETIMAHKLFKTGQIRKIPSLDEINYEEARLAGARFIAQYKEGLREGIFQPFDYKKMERKQLQALANKAGISAFHLDKNTFAKKTEKTNTQLITELEAAFNQEK